MILLFFGMFSLLWLSLDEVDFSVSLNMIGKTISLKQRGITTEMEVIMKIKKVVSSEKFVEYAKMYNNEAKTEIKT